MSIVTNNYNVPYFPFLISTVKHLFLVNTPVMFTCDSALDSYLPEFARQIIFFIAYFML